jgi:mannose-6-phosphate isomerase-like protein (cupin superfamily)
LAPPYTHRNIGDVEDSAKKYGFDETQETRFPREDLDAEQIGFAHHHFKPGKRQSFGHRHNDAEEVYLVVSGSGRINLDGELLELKRLDVIRVSPGVMRAFEAGEEGLEVVAFGAHHGEDRGEVVPGWWGD